MAESVAAIRISFVAHQTQRYPTAGDWFPAGDTLVVRVSRTADPRHQTLVAIHELVEAVLCLHDGVTADAVDAFDMGAGAGLTDPGDCPDAPYHGQHLIASAVERVMASALGVEWGTYEAALDALA